MNAIWSSFYKTKRFCKLIANLNKNNASETLTMLKDLHFSGCVSHGLVDSAEKEQQEFLSFVQSLPPHEQPNPHTIKCIYIYKLENIIICLHSLKRKKRQVDAVMGT